MAKVTANRKPPFPIPCLSCKAVNKFIESQNISCYNDYEMLDIEIINDLRTKCASCKGLATVETGSGSYKADLVMWWRLDTFLPEKHLPVGKGRTSKFTQADIDRWITIHEAGIAWVQIAKIVGVSRQTVCSLVNGRCTNLKA